MLCYYEIVRLENQGPDREEFETVSKIVGGYDNAED